MTVACSGIPQGLFTDLTGASGAAKTTVEGATVQELVVFFSVRMTVQYRDVNSVE
jgi:hypothetical protein